MADNTEVQVQPNTQVNISLENLMTMIQTAVNDIITEKVTGENGALKKTQCEIINHLNAKVDVIENEILTLKNENEEMKKRCERQQKDLEKLSVEKDNLSCQVREALIHANNIEQHNRKNSIRIFGIQTNPNPNIENCKKVASFFFTEKLGLFIEEGDIDAAHRVGRIRDGKQAIILKFFARDTKISVMEKRHKLKGTAFFVADDLTPKNSRLLNRLKNHPDIESAWVMNGKIRAKTVSGLRITCDLFMDINDACTRASASAAQHYRVTHSARAPQSPFTFAEPLHIPDRPHPERTSIETSDELMENV